MEDKKNYVKVIIDSTVYTLIGIESEDYIQSVAEYINNKIVELNKGTLNQVGLNKSSLIVTLNIADDYFKEKEKNKILEEKNSKFDNNFQISNEQALKKDKEIEQLKEECQAFGIKTGSLNSKIAELKNKLEKTQKELSQAKTNLENSEKELSVSKPELEKLKSELSQTKTEFAQSKDELSETKTKLKLSEDELSDFKAKLSLSEDQLSETKTKLKLSEDELSETKTKLSLSERELSNTKAKLDESEKEILAAKKELADFITNFDKQ